MKPQALKQQATVTDVSRKATRICWLAMLALAGLLLVQSTPATAQLNLGAPPNPTFAATGQPLPGSTWQQYTTTFTLTSSATNLTFLFRNDPAFTGLDDVSLKNSSGVEQIQDGGFESANNASFWNAVNQYGATFFGMFEDGCAGAGNHGGSGDWCDGSVGAYDAITQSGLNLTAGQYTLSFWMDTSNTCTNCDFQELSTNGQSGTQGNGIDTFAYVGNGPPPATPEPSSLALFGSGVLGIGGLLRRKARM